MTGTAALPQPAGWTMPVQAHALHAAAAFIEHAGIAGIPGLQVTAEHDGVIVISVPRTAGSPAARTALVARLAAAAGAPPPARTSYRTSAWIGARATICGHPAHVTTTISAEEEETAP
jgi:hypothetical protein